MKDKTGAELLRAWADAYRRAPEHRFPSDPHAEFFPQDMEFAAAEIEHLRKVLKWYAEATAEDFAGDNGFNAEAALAT